MSAPATRAQLVLVMGFGFLARLPWVTVSLLLVLLLRDADIPYGTIGVVTATYIISSGLAAPLAGRLVDRLGAALVLSVTAVVSTAALVGFALLADRLDGTGLVGLALVLGVGSPPLTSVQRAVLPRIAQGPALRAAYSMEAALQETLFIIGPLGVVVAVALVSPSTALLGSAAIILVAVLVFAFILRERGAPTGQRAHGFVLRSRRLRVLVLVYGLMGLSFGIAEIAAVAVCERDGHRNLAGGVLAAWSLGSLCGGLVAARVARGAPHTRLPRLLFVMTLLTAPLPLWAVHPLPLGLGLMVQGAVVAPALATVYEMIPQTAAKGLMTEAFAWASSCVFAGIGGGNAVAGWLVGSVGPSWALGAAALAPAVATVAAHRLAGAWMRVPVPST